MRLGWGYEVTAPVEGLEGKTLAENGFTGCHSAKRSSEDEQLLLLVKLFLPKIKLGQNFFISWFTNPPTVIFRKVEKKII